MRDPLPLERYAVGTPVEIEWIARKCLTKDRAQRYQTMREVTIDPENARRESISAREAIAGLPTRRG